MVTNGIMEAFEIYGLFRQFSKNCHEHHTAFRFFLILHERILTRLCSFIWVPARVEMGMDNQWYLVGLPGLRLDGLKVRQE